MEILINGKPFVATNVQSKKYNQWPVQYRTDGTQERSDRAPFPIWVQDDLSSGMGRKRWKEEEASCHFASCEFYHGSIILPLKTETSSAPSATAVLKAMCDFEGNTYGLILDSAAAKCIVWDNANTEWDIQGTILAADCDGAYSLIAHEGTLIALCDNNGTLHTYTSSDKGATWSANSDTNLTGLGPAILIGANASASGVTTADLYLATWDSTNNKIIVFKSTDDASTWVENGICDVYSEAGPQGLTWYTHMDGEEYPFLRTIEGTWIVKQIPFRAINSVPFGGNTNSFGLTVWQDYLVCPEDLNMNLYNTEGALTPFGVNSRDGFPSDYLGYITALAAVREQLFVAIKGETYAGIYRFDGSGWFPLYIDTTADRTISAIHVSGTPGQPTLFFTREAGDFPYISYCAYNPLENSSVTYESTGYIDLPYFGGRLGEADVALHSAKLYATDINDGGEEVDLYYRTLPENDFTYISTFTDPNDIKQFFLKEKEVQFRLVLKRGDTQTRTPVVYYLAIEFQQMLEVLPLLQIELDITETQQKYKRSSATDEIRQLQREKEVVSLEYKYMPETWGHIEDLVTAEGENAFTATMTFVSTKHEE